MPQRQIGRRRRFAGVLVRIGRHARIGCRRAQSGQLLGHGPQFGRRDKSLLDRAARSRRGVASALRRAGDCEPSFCAWLSPWSFLARRSLTKRSASLTCVDL